MSSNPNADAWIESYQILQGYQAPGRTAKEPLSQSLTSTNGAAYGDHARHPGRVAFGAGSGGEGHADRLRDCRRVPVHRLSGTTDHSMASGGLITTLHGAAPVVENELVGVRP